MKVRSLFAPLAISLIVVGPALAAEPLMLKDIIGMPGKEVRVLTVDAAPGASSPAHRHNGQVFVYILSGEMIMQVTGSPAITLGPGQTFYESPEDIHTMSKNASKKKSARFLVFMIVDKGAPLLVLIK